MSLNMNNLSEFEKIIKGKVENFEYPYNDMSWKKFKKSVPGKTSYWSYAALFTIVSITAICLFYYFNNQNTTGISLKNILTNNQDKSIVSDNIISEEVNDNSVDSKVVNNSISVVVKDSEKLITDNNSNENKVTGNPVINNNVIPYNNQSVLKTGKPNATFICDKKEGCLPLTVNFIPAEISDTIIYSWDFGDGNISTEKTPHHTYKDDGSFSVTLIVKYYKSEPVITNKQQNLIKIFDQPVAQFNWNKNDNSYVFENLSIGANNYKWVFSDTISTEENVNRNFKVSGKYQVQLIATNKYGCSDIYIKNLDVNIKLPVQFANSFTPDGDGGNDYFGPQVENSEDYYFDFVIYSKSGQKVYESKGKADDVSWDGYDNFSHQPAEPGYYSYQMTVKDKSGNQERRMGRFTLLRK